MIVFDLICRPEGHVFEAWFGSSEEYDGQQQRGLVECPLCGAPDVEKAVMAPRIGPKGNQRLAGARAGSELVSSDPQGVKTMLAAMAAAQKKVLEKSDYVGDRFADEARAIHLGDSNDRPIHGRATPKQTASLLDEGIQVSPLPFPVIESRDEN
ncbi:MAG: DUF1178 family protein [Pseudomonadota bacterium]|nr:DUF1178 family protein [Pseudomonadota bacterium]